MFTLYFEIPDENSDLNPYCGRWSASSHLAQYSTNYALLISFIGQLKQSTLQIEHFTKVASLLFYAKEH